MGERLAGQFGLDRMAALFPEIGQLGVELERFILHRSTSCDFPVIILKDPAFDEECLSAGGVPREHRVDLDLGAADIMLFQALRRASDHVFRFGSTGLAHFPTAWQMA